MSSLPRTIRPGIVITLLLECGCSLFRPPAFPIYRSVEQSTQSAASAYAALYTCNDAYAAEHVRRALTASELAEAALSACNVQFEALRDAQQTLAFDEFWVSTGQRPDSRQVRNLNRRAEVELQETRKFLRGRVLQKIAEATQRPI